MTVNRRLFLSMMAATPFMAPALLKSETLLNDVLNEELPMPSGTNYTCILLHGLFFMTFKNNHFVVTTPTFPHHKFGERDQGGATIGPLPSGAPDIDWTSVKLIDNTTSSQQFPAETLQFSATDVGTGPLLPNGNTAYQFKLTLPRPHEIHCYRLDDLANFGKVAVNPGPKPNGKKTVRQSIIDSCGSGGSQKIALLTGLVFKQDNGCKLPNVLSFYAEHQMKCADIKAKHINQALKAGQSLFANKTEFDLNMQDVTTPAVCPPDTDAYGVLKNDEFSACELLVNNCINTEGPRPINCAQFGVNP